MFFELSKIGWFIVTPSNAVLWCGALGLVALAVSRRRAGLVLIVLAFAAYGALGLTPVPNLAMASLENRFPPWDARGRQPTGIIVLGGSSDTAVSASRGFVALNEAAERFTEAVALARRFPQARIVFSGGDGSLFENVGNDSDDARRVFEDLGLDPTRVTFERESRNTWENAVFTRRLVEPRPGELWLVVTSAFHMPRSMGCFRAAGFDVEAYPVDFRTRSGAAVWRPPGMASDGIKRFDVVFREVVGLIVYRATGRSSDWFPSP